MAYQAHVVKVAKDNDVVQKAHWIVCISTYRVRLVERGSPHSLPLMESGKVSIGSVKILSQYKGE